MISCVEIISTQELTANCIKKKKKELHLKGCLHNSYGSLKFLWKNQMEHAFWCYQHIGKAATLVPGQSTSHGRWCCDGALVRFKSVPSHHGDAMLYRITESELEGTEKDHQVQLLCEWPMQGLSPGPWCY